MSTATSQLQTWLEIEVSQLKSTPHKKTFGLQDWKILGSLYNNENFKPEIKITIENFQDDLLPIKRQKNKRC